MSEPPAPVPIACQLVPGLRTGPPPIKLVPSISQTDTCPVLSSTAEARLAAMDAQHATEIAAERGKFERAHAELVALAGRLAAIVEQDRRSLLRYWFGWKAS
jgi:hypothetical protein